MIFVEVKEGLNSFLNEVNVVSIEEVRRRLGATPAWSDLVVVFILSLLLFGLLYYLIKIGYQWQQ